MRDADEVTDTEAVLTSEGVATADDVCVGGGVMDPVAVGVGFGGGVMVVVVDSFHVAVGVCKSVADGEATAVRDLVGDNVRGKRNVSVNMTVADMVFVVSVHVGVGVGGGVMVLVRDAESCWESDSDAVALCDVVLDASCVPLVVRSLVHEDDKEALREAVVVALRAAVAVSVDEFDRTAVRVSSSVPVTVLAPLPERVSLALASTVGSRVTEAIVAVAVLVTLLVARAL